MEGATTHTLVSAGFYSVPVAIIGGSVSILDWFLDQLNINEVDIDTEPEDFVEMNLTYDRVRKYTYVSVTGDPDEYVIGAKTLHVTIDNVYTKTFVIVDGNGESKIKNNGTDQDKKTKNFDDPADVAIANYAYGYWDEAYFECEEGDITFNFN